VRWGRFAFRRSHDATDEGTDNVGHLDVIQPVGHLRAGKHEDAERPRVGAQWNDEALPRIEGHPRRVPAHAHQPALTKRTRKRAVIVLPDLRRL